MQARERLYIGGAWAAPASDETIDVIDPCTEQVLTTIPAGTAEDVDRAVAAARGAFPGWAATPVDERGALLGKLSEALSSRADEMAAVISADIGAPPKVAKQVQTGLPQSVLSSYVEILPAFPFEEEIGNSLVVREPVGVVGAITPWNYPLHQVVAKVVPALAAGCTVVLKPSEVAPLAAFLIAEMIDDAGFPAGVFNLVSGYGEVVGEAIAAHPDIDMVSFTGSTQAGKRVTQVAAETVKRVTLELGGKSANVVLPGGDLAKAVKVGVGNAFLNSGQTCSAWSRMLVDRQRYQEAVELARTIAERYPVGPPDEETTRLGPVASAAQRDRVRAFIAKGVDEGARLVTGGAEPPEGRDAGYYVRPTVFADVRPDMTIAQEEIFGPVLSMIAYDGEEQALEIANDSQYGLSGGVWAEDRDQGVAFARRMRTGQVDVNGGRFNPRAPFGGFKQSGNGRELGRFGLEEFLETKSLQL